MNNLMIATRLKLLIGLLCLAMLGIGALGLRGIAASNAAMQSVYEDRTVALAQLAEVMRFNFRNQLALLMSVADQRPETTQKYLAEIAVNTAGMQKSWADYQATTLTPDEAVLAKSLKQHWAAQEASASSPMVKALQARDFKEASRMAVDVVPDAFLPVRSDINALVKIQVDEAKNLYEHETRAYQDTVKWAVGAIALAVVLSCLFGYSLISNITRSLGQAQGLADAVAKGDLTQEVAAEGHNEIARLIQSLSAMRQSLVSVVSRVRQGSDSVATASAEIAQGNHDLSARTESQASALEQTAASMEELGATVSHNADSARQANQLAQNASTVAIKGGAVVGQVVETMKGINDSSRKIADIISVIDGIAFQTNILALNAAVEAARAGEQGRGFAVVASEVRALAGRSAEAAKEIKVLIGSSVERVEHGTALVDQAGVTMQEVVSSIRRVTDIVAEISAAGSQQAAGVSQVGEAVNEMDQVTQQNAALVEQMAASASSLKAQAGDLVQVVSQFKLRNDAVAIARPALRQVPATPRTVPTAPRTVPTAPRHVPHALAKPAARARLTSNAKPAASKPALAPKALPRPAPKQAHAPVHAPVHAPTPKPVTAEADGEWETF